MIGRLPALAKGLVDSSRPKVVTFLKYARVELTPPTPAEIPKAVQGFGQVIRSAQTGKWKNLTVREAWLNTLVAAEIACWFFVGECIGRRHIVGYKV
jgi:F-type H+-transporting ATPase subunit g